MGDEYVGVFSSLFAVCWTVALLISTPNIIFFVNFFIIHHTDKAIGMSGSFPLCVPAPVLQKGLTFNQSTEVSQIQIWSEQLVYIPALSCTYQAQGVFWVPQKALVMWLTSPYVPLSQLLTPHPPLLSKKQLLTLLPLSPFLLTWYPSFAFYYTGALILSNPGHQVC